MSFLSIPRFLLPFASSSPVPFRFASGATGSISKNCCHKMRPGPSLSTRTYSAKRKLQTASAYRPESLDLNYPPPRNDRIPDTSIAGSSSSGIERRLSEQATQDGFPSISISELEAQISKRPAASEQTSGGSTAPKPRRSKLRPRKAAMTLTSTATDKIRSLLSQPEPKMIRVGVKNRGCSGLAYHLEYVDKAGTFDEAVEQDGVKVLIDSKALFSIIGSEMDWVEDKLNQRFVFRNPNISKSYQSPLPAIKTDVDPEEQCGCGESFMV